MQKFNLDRSYIQRLKNFYELYQLGQIPLDQKARSDFWIERGKALSIAFEEETVSISGGCGFNIPLRSTPKNQIKNEAIDLIRKYYLSLVLLTDRLLKLSTREHVGSYLPPNMAYDLVMMRDPCIDYHENPFRFDPLSLSPLFKNYKELKMKWYLKERFLVNGYVVKSAYRHAMFSHFSNGDAKVYLEIGPGTGHLAGFFHFYNNTKVVIIELPEILFYSAIYLKGIFPEAKFLLPNEIDKITPDIIMDTDFLYLLPDQIDLMPENIVDIAVSVDSLQQMTSSQIAVYFDFIQRVCKENALWCNDNRVEEVPSRDGKPIRAYEYPYSPKNEILVSEINCLTRLCQADDLIIHIEKIHK